MSRLGNALAPCLSASLWLALPHAAQALSPVTCADRPELVTLAADTGDDAPRLAAELGVPRAQEDESVPWCAREGDPRCSPLEPGSLPLEASAQPKLSSAAPIEWPLPRATPVCTVRAAGARGVPREGAASRVDRPPRSVARAN